MNRFTNNVLLSARKKKPKEKYTTISPIKIPDMSPMLINQINKHFNQPIAKTKLIINENKKFSKRAGLQSAKVTNTFENTHSLFMGINSPKIKNDHSTNSILPPITSSTNHTKYYNGAFVHKHSSDKNPFNESISTNATGLNSNNINDKAGTGSKNITRLNSGETSSLATVHESKNSLISTVTKIVPKKESRTKIGNSQSNVDRSKQSRSISPFTNGNSSKNLNKDQKSIKDKKYSKPTNQVYKPNMLNYTHTPAVINHYVNKRKVSKGKRIALHNQVNNKNPYRTIVHKAYNDSVGDSIV
jgi:hypothetical protein